LANVWGMGIIDRSGEPHESVRAGSAHGLDADYEFDPNDPGTVVVQYDLNGWTPIQLGELGRHMAEAAVPHQWEGTELLVPEQVEDFMDLLFDRLDAEIGPFAVVLDPEDPSTEFRLEEWSVVDMTLVRSALIESEIPHRWEGISLFVDPEFQDEVDDLLDAIEDGDIASIDDLGEEDEELPEGVLGRLYSIGDRLSRDAADAVARSDLFTLAAVIDPHNAPFGMPVRSWSKVVEAARGLAGAFADAEFDASEVNELGQELRTITRPFV
jgi:hypothetical protein